MTLNKTERAAIGSALDAIGTGDTATARGILAGLLDAKPRAATSDAALVKADEKVRGVILANTWQYQHNGRTTTGMVWCDSGRERGARWVVNNYTGELHHVGATRYGGRSSDGHTYTPAGKPVADCACGACERDRKHEQERAAGTCSCWSCERSRVTV